MDSSHAGRMDDAVASVVIYQQALVDCGVSVLALHRPTRPGGRGGFFFIFYFFFPGEAGWTDPFRQKKMETKTGTCCKRGGHFLFKRNFCVADHIIFRRWRAKSIARLLGRQAQAKLVAQTKRQLERRRRSRRSI